jgi:hypothetical protein
MPTARRPFLVPFLMAFALQFAVWLLYFVMAFYEETSFHGIVLWFYAPVVSLLERFQFAVGWRNWISFAVQVLFGPLLGALVYSLLIGSLVYLIHVYSERRTA